MVTVTTRSTLAQVGRFLRGPTSTDRQPGLERISTGPARTHARPGWCPYPRQGPLCAIWLRRPAGSGPVADGTGPVRVSPLRVRLPAVGVGGGADGGEEVGGIDRPRQLVAFDFPADGVLHLREHQ